MQTAYFQKSVSANGRREIKVQQKLYLKTLSRKNAGNYTCYGHVEGTNKIGQNVTNTLTGGDIWGHIGEVSELFIWFLQAFVDIGRILERFKKGPTCVFDAGDFKNIE